MYEFGARALTTRITVAAKRPNIDKHERGLDRIDIIVITSATTAATKHDNQFDQLVWCGDRVESASVESSNWTEIDSDIFAIFADFCDNEARWHSLMVAWQFINTVVRRSSQFTHQTRPTIKSDSDDEDEREGKGEKAIMDQQHVKLIQDCHPKILLAGIGFSFVPSAIIHM